MMAMVDMVETLEMVAVVEIIQVLVLQSSTWCKTEPSNTEVMCHAGPVWRQYLDPHCRGQPTWEPTDRFQSQVLRFFFVYIDGARCW